MRVLFWPKTSYLKVEAKLRGNESKRFQRFLSKDEIKKKSLMSSKKRHWFWNLLLVLTVIVCVSALIMHYKNWVSVKSDHIKLVSGFYNQTINFNELVSVVFVERLPPMERLNGFSALEKEKGVFREFKDSLTDKKIYVFVDNISQQKIKLVYRDSVKLYVNLSDSLKTIDLFNSLAMKKDNMSVPN